MLATYNGTIFYPLNPDSYDVNLEAIAYSLSTNSRFCGHTYPFWSIAQHSLLVAEYIERELSDKIKNAGYNVMEVTLMGLLHDASEAYLSNICRPIKKHISGYLEHEDFVEGKVLKAFGVKTSYSEVYEKFIKEADDAILYTEATVLMNPSDKWLEECSDCFNNPMIDRYKNKVVQQNMQIVEAMFIDKVKGLCGLLGIHNTPVDNLPESKDILNMIPIYRLGNVRYYIEISAGNSKIYDSLKGTVKTYSNKFLNNCMDIFEALDSLGGVT